MAKLDTDNNSKPLPKAVQAQLDAAEEIEKQLNSEAQSSDVVPIQQSLPLDEPQQSKKVEKEEKSKPSDVEKDKDAKYWESKYKTLEGKYSAEVPRLSSQIQALSEQFQRQVAENMQLKASLEESSHKKEEDEAPKTAPLITEKDIEYHGEELADFVRRAAQQAVNEVGLHKIQMAVTSLTEKVNNIVSQLEGINNYQAAASVENMQEKVLREVPDYNEINTMPEFSEWLNEVDAFTGIQRIVLAQDAINNANADRLIAILKAFKSQMNMDKQEDQTVNTDIEKHIEPDVSEVSVQASSVDDLTSDGRIWTESEYKQVYDPRFMKRVGREQADRLQKLADAALRNNRIRFGT